VKRFFSIIVLAWAAAFSAAADEKPSEKELAQAKEELQKLGEFIGQWNLGGEGTVDGKKANWKETWEWSWKFAKTGESSIVVKVKDGKFFAEATVTYDAKAKGFKASVIDAAKDTNTMTGTIDRKGAFLLERTDAKSKDVHKLKFGTAAEGIRLNISYDVQTGGKGLATTIYKSNGSKDGESIASAKKKNECIVTGGAATTAVTHAGKTYYVCCSGCLEAFKEDPEKFIKAAAAKK